MLFHQPANASFLLSLFVCYCLARMYYIECLDLRDQNPHSHDCCADPAAATMQIMNSLSTTGFKRLMCPNFVFILNAVWGE